MTKMMMVKEKKKREAKYRYEMNKKKRKEKWLTKHTCIKYTFITRGGGAEINKSE